MVSGKLSLRPTFPDQERDGRPVLEGRAEYKIQPVFFKERFGKGKIISERKGNCFWL